MTLLNYLITDAIIRNKKYNDKNQRTMTDNTIVYEAANKYADEHAFRVPYDGSNEFYDDNDFKWSKEGFLAGVAWQAQQQPLSGKGVDEDELNENENVFCWQGFLNMAKEIVDADKLSFGERHEKLQEIKSFWLTNKAATKGYSLQDLGNAFDAGVMFQYNSNAGDNGGLENEYPNKAQYLSSINKK